MPDAIWRFDRGEGPIVATAIHDGHGLRGEILPHMALSDADRLREEDPFTGRWTAIAPTRLIGLRSRFEVDLNRPRNSAVYRRPEDAWGLEIWKGELPEDLAARSLEGYDDFYAALEGLCRSLAERHGRFLVLDIHSYNHLRGGPGQPPADPEGNPQVNIGTGTLHDRAPWAGLIDRFISDLAAFDFPGGGLDVRENVRFRGGAMAAWIHQAFPGRACALSVEIKKFFMDEWTGEADEALIDEIGRALAGTLPGVLEELERG